MLTARVLKNAETAKQYYTEHLARSEYYSNDHKSKVQWFGLGCLRLGLEPETEVTQEAFERLCENRHPFTGEKLTARHRTGDRRVCFDFVVSPPKSVSLIAELGGDVRVVGVHEAAVLKTMRRLEALAGTRVRKGGRDEERTTGELVAARVTHTTSRALDPQLHTHFVMFNATWDPVESRWKALQTTRMFEQLGLFTEVYRSELAAGLKQLGCRLRSTVNGFEVEGVSPELIQRFSKRRRAILEADAKVSEKIGSALSNNARATLAQTTRDWKDVDLPQDQIRREQLSQLTAQELEQLRALVPNPSAASVDGGAAATTGFVEEKASPTVSVAEAVNHARDHLFERRSAVPRHALLKEALAFGHGHIGIEQVEAELERRSEFLEFEGLLTTYEMVQREGAMVKQVNAGMGQFAPLHPGAGEASGLNPEQRIALRAVMNSVDWVMGIRGVAGSGKSELLGELVGSLSESGRPTVVLAPTTAACDALRSRGVRWASMLQHFLADTEFQTGSKGKVVIVDEAGLLSVGDMLQLLNVARNGGNRIILCGDTRQHSGIEAGDALRLLETRSAMQCAGLYRNTRQRRREYREAIQAFAAGRPTEGFARLESMGALHETTEDRRYEGLATAYLNSLDRKKSALIVSPTWREIREITQEVRARLKAVGRLGPDEAEVEVHSPLHWTRAEKRDFRNYREGMRLHFHRASTAVARGESLRVTRVDADAVVATRPNGQEVRITRKQAGCFEVMSPAKLPVSSGEVLLLQGNLKAHGLINGKCVQVRTVRPDGGLDLADGRTIPPNFRTFTHGHCVTSLAAQGRTVDHVYVAVGSESIQATNSNQFYVSASRGREEIQIFTDDLEGLRGAVGRSGRRLAALELAERARQAQAVNPSDRIGVRV